MQFWALIVDSLRESMDRKIFWVMAALTLLVATAMASLGFEADRVSILFGTWKVETTHFNPTTATGQSRIAGILVYVLMDFFLGTVGIILALIATGSMLPSFLERGGIDILLAKPLSRPTLFVYKYMSGLVFILLQATAFVGLTFLVAGLRWGTWVPGYLFSIPLLVLLFSYVYCVSAWVAVKFRSTVAAILLSIAAWIIFPIPSAIVPLFDTFPSLKQYERVYQCVQVAAWIPPKIAEVPYLAAQLSQAGTSIDIFPDAAKDRVEESDALQIQAVREMEQKLLTKNPLLSIGSSLLFEAIIVGWAIWAFARRDF